MFLFGIVLGAITVVMGLRMLLHYQKSGPWPKDIDPDDKWGTGVSFSLGAITAGIAYILVSIFIL